jgi:hypothetical protein
MKSIDRQLGAAFDDLKRVGSPNCPCFATHWMGSAFARHVRELPDFDLVIAGPDPVERQGQLTKLAIKLSIAARVPRA